MKRTITDILTSAVLILAVASGQPVLAAAGQAGEERGEETYTMVAVPTRGSLPGRATIDITLRINEYTTDEELRELADVLREGGTDALRRRMEKIQKGKITPRGRIGADVAGARVRKTEEGERIIVVTARTIPGFELYVSGRSRDYPFSWFEFEVDEEGKGFGSAIVAAKLQFNDEGQLEITSYGVQPFQLTNIKRW